MKNDTTTTGSANLQHMTGCRCDDWFGGDSFDAFMVDERVWGQLAARDGRMDVLTTGSLMRALQEAARAAGSPFVSTVQRRRNADGEPIGPLMESRVCEMVEYLYLCQEVSALVERSARRIAGR